MNGCIYRTKDGECDLYSEGGKYHAFCVDGPCEGRKPSNADRIRAMTDEELAWAYAYRLASCYGCEASIMEDCAKCTREWLRQEADT